MADSRPSFDEWRYWFDVLARRYRYAAETYRKNDRPAEADELADTSRLAKSIFLDVHTARTATPPQTDDDLSLMIESAIGLCIALAKKTIMELPIVSRLMQESLKVTLAELSWEQGGIGAILEFFLGERGNPAFAIGSGNAKDGGLAAEFARLIEAEAKGGNAARAPKYLPPGELEAKTRGAGAALRQKAPFNDWWYWSDVLAKRMKLISDLYRQNDETDRSNETGGHAKKLQDLFLGTARLGQKGAKTPEEKAALVAAEEASILDAVELWRTILSSLPFISTQMQDFLGVKWQELNWEKGTDAPKALELFCGPKGRTDEGIRSGVPSDGGLPGIMMNYLMSERGSTNRSPTQYRTEAAHQTYWRSSAPGAGGKM